MKTHTHGIIVCSGLLAAGSLHSGAQITVDGTLDAAYGSPLATQTINTGFGDSTVANGASTGGSELDAAYGVAQNGYLYLFFSGNLENNGNNINIFIADGRSGESTLSVPGLGGNSVNDMAPMNGSRFSPGFSATYALDINYVGATIALNSYDLINHVFVDGGFLTLSGGIGNTTLGSTVIGVNNLNILGVNGNTGTTANAAAANAVKTGFEVGIPLAYLGNPLGSIKVLADINGAFDDYVSNQLLPGLPVGTGNLGAGGPYSAVPGSAGFAGFNLSTTPGEYFTVAIPEPSGMPVLAGVSALILLALSKRKS